MCLDACQCRGELAAEDDGHPPRGPAPRLHLFLPSAHAISASTTPLVVYDPPVQLYSFFSQRQRKIASCTSCQASIDQKGTNTLRGQRPDRPQQATRAHYAVGCNRQRGLCHVTLLKCYLSDVLIHRELES